MPRAKKMKNSVEKHISKNDAPVVFNRYNTRSLVNHNLANTPAKPTKKSLISVCYFIQKEIDRTIYFNAKKNRWRSAILADLHILDRITADIHVISEGGTTLASDLNICGYMNW